MICSCNITNYEDEDEDEDEDDEDEDEDEGTRRQFIIRSSSASLALLSYMFFTKFLIFKTQSWAAPVSVFSETVNVSNEVLSYTLLYILQHTTYL